MKISVVVFMYARLYKKCFFFSSTALQLVLCPFLRSNSLYQNLGAAVVANEWAILYKTAVTKCVLCLNLVLL